MVNPRPREIERGERREERRERRERERERDKSCLLPDSYNRRLSYIAAPFSLSHTLSFSFSLSLSLSLSLSVYNTTVSPSLSVTAYAKGWQQQQHNEKGEIATDG
jgi:hypothetical protein